MLPQLSARRIVSFRLRAAGGAQRIPPRPQGGGGAAGATGAEQSRQAHIEFAPLAGGPVCVPSSGGAH